MNRTLDKLSRRQLLKAGAAAGTGLVLPGIASAAAYDAACGEVLCREIPATGETIPVVGVGTNRFGPTGLDAVKDVLTSMHELGGRVIDTAAMYGGSEEVIGQALKDLGLQDDMFVATKFNVAGAQFSGGVSDPGPDEPTATESFERSLEWLQMDSVDLLFAHFLGSVEPLMPQMIELRDQGKARYIGITTVDRSQHPRMMDYMRRFPIDFIQVDYSIENRETAEDVLPLAAELGIATMIAVPFGGGRNSLFSSVGDNEVPDWAADFGATTWARFFLKYIVSNPAVTCVIPGTTEIRHMEDNQAAGMGDMPDEATRRRMEEFWDTVAT